MNRGTLLLGLLMTLLLVHLLALLTRYVAHLGVVGSVTFILVLVVTLGHVVGGGDGLLDVGAVLTGHVPALLLPHQVAAGHRMGHLVQPLGAADQQQTGHS